ncbi:MAG: VOC family protein [Ilumatobacteraceae bacterium]
MPIHFNHTIVHSADREAEATWFTGLFGLPPAVDAGYFLVADIADQASIDFARADREVHGQHYAFLVSDADFDGIHGRIVERGLDHWADPAAERAGEINHHDGGRGVYFTSPSGHFFEIITRPYGGGDPV